MSLRPISLMSSLFPLNANDDVRDATRNACTLLSALMISSAIPSQKKSWSCCGLMSENASTAIDLADVFISGGVDVPLGQVSAWEN